MAAAQHWRNWLRAVLPLAGGAGTGSSVLNVSGAKRHAPCTRSITSDKASGSEKSISKSPARTTSKVARRRIEGHVSDISRERWLARRRRPQAQSPDSRSGGYRRRRFPDGARRSFGVGAVCRRDEPEALQSTQFPNDGSCHDTPTHKGPQALQAPPSMGAPRPGRLSIDGDEHLASLCRSEHSFPPAYSAVGIGPHTWPLRSEGPNPARV